MINYNSTSNILIVFSLLTFAVLFFVGLAIPDRKEEIISFSFDTSFLILIIGYILRQKSIQQLIGLFLFLLVYNFDILKGDLFQIQNEDMLYFFRHYTFYVAVVSFLFIIPTTLDKYKFEPLTNRTNIKDSTIILTSIFMTIIIQTTIRMTV